MNDETRALIEELRAYEHSHQVQSRDGFRPDHAAEAERHRKYADALEGMAITNDNDLAYQRRLEAQIAEVRYVLNNTPDVTVPGVWWPLGMDDPNYRAGAIWIEAWWRLKLTEALSPAHNGFDHCPSCQAAHQAKGDTPDVD